MATKVFNFFLTPKFSFAQHNVLRFARQKKA